MVFLSSIVYLNFWKRFLVNRRKDVFYIKSWYEEVIVVFILEDVITLVCNGFLITQLLPSWATCCGKPCFSENGSCPLFLPAQLTSFLTHKYEAWLPWIAFVYSQTTPFTLTTCHFVRLCKAFYISKKWRRFVDGVWFVRIRNTSGYQPDISLPGSVFIVLEERLVVVAQNGWDVEFHNSITPSSILFLLTGTKSWRWKSSCPALQLLQTRW